MVSRWVGLVAGLAVVLGCGPSSSEASTGVDGEGSGSSSAGESTGTTTAPPVTVSLVTTEGEPVACEDFESESDVGPPVTASVRNDSGDAIFIALGGCFGTLPMTIRDEAGDVIGWQLGDCFPETCDGFIDQGDCSMGCPDCGGVAPLRVETGATYEFEWSGGLYSSHQLPPGCVGGMQCPSTCQRLDQAEAATYSLELSIFADCVGDGCDCIEPPVNGACSIAYYPQLDAMSLYEALVDYPNETVAAFVIL